MMMPGVGRLWATRQDSCMRRQDAAAPRDQRHQLLVPSRATALKSDSAYGSRARHASCGVENGQVALEFVIDTRGRRHFVHEIPPYQRPYAWMEEQVSASKQTAAGRLGGRSIDLRRVLIRRRTTPASCRRFCWEFPWFRSAKVQDCVSGPPCLKNWRFLGATRIAAWIEPPASLPERGAEHSHKRGPLHPKTDQQSSHLDGQIRATERSQAPRGLRQRLRRRRTMLATNRVQSPLRRIAADGLGTELTLGVRLKPGG